MQKMIGIFYKIKHYVLHGVDFIFNFVEKNCNKKNKFSSKYIDESKNITNKFLYL